MAITTSTTTINEIDAEYPVAGQDNDSQGFRDNFSAIKSGLTTVAADLLTLDTETAKKIANNDFNYNKITNAVFVGNVEDTYNAGAWDEETITINYNNGHYQTFQVNVSTLNVAFDWPNFSAIPGGGALCKIRLVISGSGTESTVTFGGTTVRKNYSGTMTVESTTRPRVVDVWTDDGAVIYVQDHGEFF